ncbi:hypothetical protein NDU88_005363 [Pleurodeles waltl]|uniref:Uncharacterized protein n=1 Tax=Pleurodeles waltl TaxID=8319 RepID=A0AAV7MCP9_PLEWA|nr:hypothetical protein NDU88_005361 [Pleurodeles waltl]KAJ1100276.1 hypothetical protein NDU88_005362 [Pleurodeles waltl]KAJ1100277.1 hypothetical protein NDU88_005363 [Pleurodeles waltl]
MCDRSDRDRASSAALLQLGSPFTGRYDACIYPDTGTFPIPHPGCEISDRTDRVRAYPRGYPPARVALYRAARCLCSPPYRHSPYPLPVSYLATRSRV